MINTIEYPQNPSIGDQFTVGGTRKEWDGTRWRNVSFGNHERRLQANDSTLKAILKSLGYSGNYGFFEKGFFISDSLDVGIDSLGNIWKYIGNSSLPFEVEKGTDPLNNSLFSKVNLGRKIFSSVNDMVNSKVTFSTGDFVETENYYSDGYGGGAKYKIEDGSDADGFVDHNLSNNKKAVLQFGYEIDVKCAGLQCWSDRKIFFDNKDNFLALMNKISPFASVLDKPYPIAKFSGGVWQFSDTCLQARNGMAIEGVGGWSITKSNNTIITAFGDNQQYVWKCGGLPDVTSNPLQTGFDEGSLDKYLCNGARLTGLQFSTQLPDPTAPDYTYTILQDVEYGALVLDYFVNGELENIRFIAINGTGLMLRDVWETEMDIMFRDIGNKDKPKLLFEECSLLNGSIYGNFSANHIKNVMFESVNGHWIENRSTRLTNTHIGLLQGEFSACLRQGTDGYQSSVATIDPNNVPVFESWKIFNNLQYGTQLTIDSINVEKLAGRIITFSNGDKYCLDTIIEGGYNNITIGAIALGGGVVIDPILIHSSSVNFRTMITIGSIDGVSEDSTINKYPIVDVQSGNIRLLSEPKLDINTKTPIRSSELIFAADALTTGYNRVVTDKSSRNPNKLVVGLNSVAVDQEVFRVTRPVNYNKTEVVRVRFKAPNGQAYRIVLGTTYEGVGQSLVITGTGTGDWEERIATHERFYADNGLWIIKDESTLRGLLIDSIEFELKHFTQRPTHTSEMYIGTMVYDKVLNQPIYLDDNLSDWLDSNGNIV